MRAMIMLLGCLVSTASYSAAPHDYFNRWQELERQQRWHEALALAREAAHAHPAEAWFRVYVGYALARSGAGADALAYLRDAARMAPADAGIRGNLVWGLLNRASELGFGGGHWAEAVALYREAVEADPAVASAWNLLGNGATQAGDHRLALEAMRNWWRLAPADIAVEGYRANFRHAVMQGVRATESATAIAFAELGNAVLPGDGHIAMRLMELYAAARRIDDAEALVQRTSDEALRYLILGAFWLQMHQDYRAAENFEHASRLATDRIDIDSWISDSYRTRVEHLPYPEQMAHPLHAQAVDYATRAVRKQAARQMNVPAMELIAPLAGRFCTSNTEGHRSFHYGLTQHYSYDLEDCERRSAGMPVRAVADGTVLEANFEHPDRHPDDPVDFNARPNLVRIAHGAVISEYAHLRQGSGRVRAGDTVRAGQVIGAIGNSGISTRPHLHFRIVDPATGYSLPARITGLRQDGRPEDRLASDTRYESD